MQQLPDRESFQRVAAIEAVNRLGLLKSEAANTVYRLLNNDQGFHPKVICTAFRSEGAQLSEKEKAELNIRKNAFMTREALAELSEAGMQQPIHAHELTVLRASFGMFRHRNALSAESMMRENPQLPVEVRYDVFHSDSCAVWVALHHKTVGEDWGLLPPNDCTCVTAPYSLHIYVDWIGELVEYERSMTLSEKM